MQADEEFGFLFYLKLLAQNFFSNHYLDKDQYAVFPLEFIMWIYRRTLLALSLQFDSKLYTTLVLLLAIELAEQEFNRGF